ncbi:hypothetical protein B4098_2945 [Heyndrickxia coagulans]|uniref:Uncharacterized protein n=1 Tax=Heyndrickxia coagulans TaxID=1398 RepID=A0A150JSQ1_HEYCO|nr:hypothetical protein BCO26_1627 [Heyndrickxia coagulans 2-6]KYC60262.1 hypothetical protein B4098_2945 [Heyndrickxia coagulans]
MQMPPFKAKNPFIRKGRKGMFRGTTFIAEIHPASHLVNGFHPVWFCQTAHRQVRPGSGWRSLPA